MPWLALAELGVAGTAAWARAAAAAGGAARLFESSPAELATFGLDRVQVRALRGFGGWKRLRADCERCRRTGIVIASLADPEYPPLLRQIADPALVLYYRGMAPAVLTPAVAVVGSRRASRYGRHVAASVAGELVSAGVTVVSGLAVGIDTAAHEGALASTPPAGAAASAAVLAGGLDRVYPASNRGLFEQLAAKGSVIAEHAPGTAPLPYRFPIRNRLITGMCAATVVVEASARSGSLVSARLALEQGREVLAVPGNIDVPTAAGPNRLIRDGCAPLVEITDALAAIGVTPAVRQVEEKTRDDAKFADPDAATVVAALDALPTSLDDLIEATRLDGARIMELLTALELEGVVERSPGATFVLRSTLPAGRRG